MRITSLTASASTVGRLFEDIVRKATAFRPDAILWVSNNTSDPQAIARAMRSARREQATRTAAILCPGARDGASGIGWTAASAIARSGRI